MCEMKGDFPWRIIVQTARVQAAAGRVSPVIQGLAAIGRAQPAGHLVVVAVMPQRKVNKHYQANRPGRNCPADLKELYDMKRYSSNKDIHRLVRRLIKEGCSYISGAKHRRLVSPNGNKLTIPGTPSDYRAYQNFNRDARRLIGE